jgi:hypothetical protein
MKVATDRQRILSIDWESGCSGLFSCSFMSSWYY